MKAAIFTLGCKVNQFESQAIQRELLSRGHEIVGFGEVADAYIINTCTVTSTSDKKSRQAVRRARRTNPDAIVAVCGCYVQVSPAETEKLGADLLCGTADRISFVSLLERAWKDKKPIVSVGELSGGFEELPAGGLSGRTRALLKIEDGCDSFCSYCIIPYARGRVRSLPLSKIREQARQLVDAGYREIVLTGIEISAYGRDLKDKMGLCDAVEAVCSTAIDARVRLGSLEPRTVTEEFCERLSKLPNLCPHFHVSLQSGCDETLLRMNRKYDTARYFESVSLLRRYFSGCAIMCDVIAGFPGESQEEYEKTCTFVKKCGFAAMHVFPYSKRKGTRASEMDSQVPRAEKELRAGALIEIGKAMSCEYRSSQIGKTLHVLFETSEGGVWTGHSENYMEVSAAGSDLRGRILPVRITGLRAGGLSGDIVEE